MSKLKVNEDLCIGCGTCESLYPQAFKLENGKAEVISEDCNADEAVSSCPVGAISKEE